MTQTICRLYGTEENAAAAVTELRELGFDEQEIHVVKPRDGASTEELADAIMKCYVYKLEAKAYAEGVKRGNTLVAVHAGFGWAMPAIIAMERCHPVESGVPDWGENRLDWDEAAPFSSAFHLPLLTDGPSPFSSFWGLPVLTKGGESKGSLLGLPLLTSSSGEYKGLLGLPLLSSNPAPLSSIFGLPTLKR